jgi:hypothetical protein
MTQLGGYQKEHNIPLPLVVIQFMTIIGSKNKNSPKNQLLIYIPTILKRV